MKIELNNICKISHCNITLDGITVIAGENGTGKSTVGKALYSVFNSFYNLKEQIRKTRKSSLYSVFRKYNDNDRYMRDSYIYGNIVDELIDKAEKFVNNEDLLQKHISSFVDESEEFIVLDENIDELIAAVLSVLKIEEKQLICRILQNRISSEFNSQVSNLYNEDANKIKMTIKGNTVEINLENNEITSCNGVMDLYANAIYIDDPYIIYPQRRFFASSSYYDHKSELKEKLMSLDNENNVIDDIITNEKLNNIYTKIEDICEGNLSFFLNRSFYILPNGKKLDIQNVATGLTTFVIIKTLLQRGIIKEKGLIILDEPETHLHPKWQLLFAEIVVLLQKEFNLTILLNTHSPYFLEAIQVYSEKYEIDKKCKYYLSDNDKTNNVFVINDVTDNVDLIYKKLASPFQVLENERCSSDD